MGHPVPLAMEDRHTNATIQSSLGVAVDGNGNIFVSDFSAATVVKYLLLALLRSMPE